MGLRRLIGVGLLCALSACARADGTAWTDWHAFKQRFIQDDGRVIDLSFDQRSTSEGQGYGLFFALVANDRATFERLLQWTQLNLAGRSLGETLPAWHWGRLDDGGWGTVDRNAAADGDLWIAHALIEAGRLWDNAEYSTLGRRLLDTVARQETVVAGKTGALLLPGPLGFVLDGERYRIDPSYIPPFQFRLFQTIDPDGPWGDILENYLRQSEAWFPAGVAPDTLVVDRDDRAFPDTEREPRGSYDAIRVYLWAGMSGADCRRQLAILAPFAELIRNKGVPPEKVDPASGKPVANEWAPIGFSAAVLPYLKALGETSLAEAQLKRLRRDRSKAHLLRRSNYYDEALVLFGKGWWDGRYRFDAQGRLHTAWSGGAP